MAERQYPKIMKGAKRPKSVTRPPTMIVQIAVIFNQSNNSAMLSYRVHTHRSVSQARDA
jgi:hypothetical protein